MLAASPYKPTIPGSNPNLSRVGEGGGGGGGGGGGAAP